MLIGKRAKRSNNMNLRAIVPIGVALLALMVLGSCSLGVPEYVLTVFLEEGVTGIPEDGTHEHAELDKVDYRYSPVDTIHTVEVFIGPSRFSAVGSLTMYNDQTLTARLVDIRLSWDVALILTDAAENAFEFTITLNGASLTSGTFSDSRGYNGIWTAENDDVTLTYGDWEDYVLIGLVFDMNGTFTGGGTTGTWSTSRADTIWQFGDGP
ncbi:MAG: hypothetical protein WBB73_06685 [Candidatus Aminicenantaceae bacterium]